VAKRRYSTRTAARHAKANKVILGNAAIDLPFHHVMGIVHQGLPDHHPVSFFVRKNATAADAINAWAADDSEGASRAWRAKIGKRILTALGPDRMDDWPKNVGERRFHYEAAEAEVERIAIAEKGAAGESELDAIVKPVLLAYSWPLKFFRVVAPRLAPSDFQLHPGSVPALRKTLWRWGHGALLNPNVRRAFDWLALNRRDAFNETLKFVEERAAFVPDGRRKGRCDSAPRKRKPSKYTVGWQDGLARSSSAIEKKARKSTGGVIATIRVHAKMSGLKPATLRREFYRKTPRIKKLPNQK
jgi:hypothetical protein